MSDNTQSILTLFIIATVFVLTIDSDILGNKDLIDAIVERLSKC